MQVKDLNVNQLIEISIDEEGTEYKYLASRIEEVSDKYLHVSIPTKKGVLMPFNFKQKLIIDLRYKGRSFRFDTVIENRHFYPIPVLVLLKPESIIEIQRRNWVRVTATLPLRYCLTGEEKSKIINLGTSVDISGGGICFLTNDPVEAGQVLDMQINLPDREPVICQTKVLRLHQPNGRNSETTKVFSEYIDITEAQRDRIVSFVLEKQRELIKRGLL